MKDHGYIDGKNIKIDYQNAQGDQSTLQTIYEPTFKNDLVLVGLQTPAKQAIIISQSIDWYPSFSSTAITDPVSAKLVKSMDKVGGLATGTSDHELLQRTSGTKRKVMPNLKKLDYAPPMKSETQRFRCKRSEAKDLKKLVLKRLSREFTQWCKIPQSIWWVRRKPFIPAR